MADKASTSVQMDGMGRITIPMPTRKALDIENVSADLELEVEVLERHDDPK